MEIMLIKRNNNNNNSNDNISGSISRCGVFPFDRLRTKSRI